MIPLSILKAFIVVVAKYTNWLDNILKIILKISYYFPYQYTKLFVPHKDISMLTEGHAHPTMIKIIAGHSGSMSLTEKVYTHLDIEVLVAEINKI